MSTRTVSYVTFFIPGSFYNEETRVPISSWSIEEAKAKLASAHRWTFGFQFSKVIESDPVPDGQGGFIRVQGKMVDTSGMYYVGGQVRDIVSVLQANIPEEDILRDNMRANWAAIVKTSQGNSQPFNKEDVLLDKNTFEVLERGDSEALMSIRMCWSDGEFRNG